MQITLIFSLFILFQNQVSASKWIGVEHSVLDKLKKDSISFIDQSKKIISNNENFFLVEESAFALLGEQIHHQFGRCGGFRVLPAHPSQEKKRTNKKNNILRDYTLTQKSSVNEFSLEISTEYMNSIVIHLTSYRTRFYTSPEGKQAMEWIHGEWARLTAHRNDTKVQYHHYKDHPQPTVILTIQGKNPKLQEEIIILGGHGDSINSKDHEGDAPGADDNAAGIAVLSDIIRILMLKNYSPEHTVQFIAYAAEEVGIQGSYELARVYREQNKNVIGTFQFDGLNFKGKTYDMALISDHTNYEQNIFTASLIDEYLKINWTWDKCDYACSDHSAWNHEGYPASFAIEAILKEENPFIHTPQDTFDKSFNNTNHAANFTKLGLAYLLELDL